MVTHIKNSKTINFFKYFLFINNNELLFFFQLKPHKIILSFLKKDQKRFIF